MPQNELADKLLNKSSPYTPLLNQKLDGRIERAKERAFQRKYREENEDRNTTIESDANDTDKKLFIKTISKAEQNS